MDNYVRVYDNMLPVNFCDEMIARFEMKEEQQKIRKEGSMSLTEINLSEHDDWNVYTKTVSKKLIECVAKYANECKITPNQWPKKYGYESIRIKRYLSNGIDEFGSHVDVTNYENARRFLVFFAYLDDNSKGQTVISPKDDLFMSSCTKGSILIFPPMWPWAHEGRKPVNKSKYILGSYLHYV